MLTVSVAGRKKLLLTGLFASELCLFAASYSIKYDKQWLTIIFINAWGFFYNGFSQTTMYVWTTEVVPDVALGLNSVAILFTVFLYSVVEFGLINGLGPHGFFNMLGFESFIGLLFVYWFVGETKHLSENAKKEQYWPGAIYGRKLMPGELCEATPEVWSKATK